MSIVFQVQKIMTAYLHKDHLYTVCIYSRECNNSYIYVINVNRTLWRPQLLQSVIIRQTHYYFKGFYCGSQGCDFVVEFTVARIKPNLDPTVSNCKCMIIHATVSVQLMFGEGC